jgi:hypothetical protein
MIAHARLRSIATTPNILRHVSLVRDTNLNDTENFYLRWTFEACNGKNYWSPTSVMLENIWAEYGVTPENESLLFATLCAGHRLFTDEEKENSDILYFTSKFCQEPGQGAGRQDYIRMSSPCSWIDGEAPTKTTKKQKKKRMRIRQMEQRTTMSSTTKTAPQWTRPGSRP